MKKLNLIAAIISFSVAGFLLSVGEMDQKFYMNTLMGSINLAIWLYL